MSFDKSYTLSYNFSMRKYEWSSEKNVLLQDIRSLSFEDVVAAIQDKRILDEKSHPNQQKYAHQRMFFVIIHNYVHTVPYVVKEDGTIFLKTIIPNREATRRYRYERSTDNGNNPQL